ncbi:SGNH/GDSL hydrolase family protein [Umezawaea endophytica]|uniref:SGNH/GDSL hydrolase family protein n=1 Tax=Umezawaea endophytica TaxID=1654476 RepID=A0A9X3AHR5_9PSEU|nr:SGNH/GDSL hydrolase family protein [Umezawaea endophytica]MCS7481952.1 SGNH/GDSL hydrolase family protein [Umezawaea endophytica]
MTRTYLRYVALGDSQTEGMNDGDDTGGYRGWADRLAEQLAAADPRVRYANLAVRGRTAHQVRAEQLPVALDLRPDLATVMIGMNDLLRPRFHATSVARHHEHIFEALTGQGAHVVTFRFPDPGLLVPAARWLTRRTHELNARVREAADRHGATVVDLFAHPVCTDPRLWSADRLHLNALGHSVLAAAVAHALDLPGSDVAWSNPLDPLERPTSWRRAGTELRWATGFVGPWLVRRAFGRSSSDGRTAKRPVLTPVGPRPERDHVS